MAESAFWALEKNGDKEGLLEEGVKWTCNILRYHFHEVAMRQVKIFQLWMILKYVAFSIIVIVTFNMVSEAYDIKQAVTWVNEKVTKLVWSISGDSPHHYRVEVTKTKLLQEPVTSYISYTYSQDDSIQIELDDDCSYTFYVQSVDEYGALSPYSDQSPLYIYKKAIATETVSVSDEKPQEFSLSQNFPNPFNNQTKIQYYLPSSNNYGDSVPIELVIYNALGQKIRTIVNGSFPPGSYMQIWDGRDDSGREVSSGQYIYQIIAGNYRASKKMMLMK